MKKGVEIWVFVVYNAKQGDFPLVRKGGNLEREQGKLIFNRYIILKTLYSGTNSRVYLSKHIGLDDKRIIKRLVKNLVCEENFHSEANVLKNLKHNGIPIIYDIVEEQDAYYIIEEYIDGVTLYDYVKDKGPLSEEVAINFGIQISEIIAYLHKQKPVPILYLDLKPQNIMINNGRLYLVDFGNSMFINSKRSYMSGTKGYAAPEQYEFNEIDFRADIYGIGALLYFMVTGLVCNNNFDFNTNSFVSDEFKNIIIRCMSPKDERVNDALWVTKNLNEIIHEKIRKKEEKNEKENLMGKPLVVAVVGAQRHIGVTHFSLALTSRLNECGIRTIYEDRSGEIIKSIYKNSDKCTLSAGIYYYENVLMKFAYSGIINLEDNVNCKIVDCSREEVASMVLEEIDVLILIAGGKPWEIDESKVAIEGAQKKYGLKSLIFWNFMKEESSDCVPLFWEPFCRNTDINHFFDNVISKIFEEENVYKKENRKRIFRFFTRKK